MGNFPGFLDALGQAFGGYSQDQQRRAKSEDDDFSRDFQLRQAGYMPTQTPGVGALTAPLHGGAQAYAFDFDQSPQGKIEARQVARLNEQTKLEAQKRTLANKRAYGTLHTQFSADPASTDDYNDDLDYAAALKEAQAAARDARKAPPWEAQKSQALQNRVRELVAKGVKLEDANRRARQEFGENVGEAPSPTITVLPGAAGLPPQGVVTHGPGVGTAIPIPEVSKNTGNGGASSASITKAIATNNQQLSYIDQAIAAVKEHPQAFGLTRGLPVVGSALDQRVDPEGVKARSLVSNIGSMQIHDRTGAAMSVHEEKRLAGFVPGPSDTPAKIIENLEQLRQGLAENNSAMQHGGTPQSGSAQIPPLSPKDRLQAKRDPKFAQWLRSKGYEVP